MVADLKVRQVTLHVLKDELYQEREQRGGAGYGTHARAKTSLKPERLSCGLEFFYEICQSSQKVT